MKSFLFFLPLFSALVFAEDKTCEDRCPQVKCPANDAVELCNCLNDREIKCAAMCPDYIPLLRPCPINPPSNTMSSPSPKPTACTCDRVVCPMIWPLSCHCFNEGKEACYEKCGGLKPELDLCVKPTSTLITSTKSHKPSTTKTPNPSTTKPTPTPTSTHAPCGGGRGNYIQCEDGYACIKDPFKPGCGPECDGLGICVEDNLCGGFAGFACKDKTQTCVDDPRDSCDPRNGGADCGGLCVWAH